MEKTWKLLASYLTNVNQFSTKLPFLSYLYVSCYDALGWNDNTILSNKNASFHIVSQFKPKRACLFCIYASFLVTLVLFWLVLIDKFPWYVLGQIIMVLIYYFCSGWLSIMQLWHPSVSWSYLDLLTMSSMFHGECKNHIPYRPSNNFVQGESLHWEICHVQEIGLAFCCFSSSVDGLCWSYNYCNPEASHSVCWAGGVGSR